MNRVFLLLIFIYWYLFLLVKSSSSFFDFDNNLFQESYYVNENFSIGATFKLPTSYECIQLKCVTNLKLTIRNNNYLSVNLWCDSPAVLITNTSMNMEELSCVLNGINATLGSYRLSATVQVYNVGSFVPIFSAIFPNNPTANQEWVNKEIIILNSPINKQQPIKLPTIERMKRQDINVDGNQPIQLNIYTGTLNPGYTADLTCNGASSCPNYPQIDTQGRAICCFPLPQTSDGITALSSVIYQNGAQNLKDFQVNVGTEQSFNAANDLSVFLSPIIATSQCNVILSVGASQFNSAIFRITWTYHSSSTDTNSPSPSTAIMTDGTLPVNVLRVTSTSAFVQKTARYNEWFVCPPSQDSRVSILRSIAVLTGNNVDYFRCIYVNNQGIPLKDPTTGQLLVFTSSKNNALDNPTITTLPIVHTDCISIQFFSIAGTSIDLNSILLSITIAFQTVPSTDMSSIMPQVSDLQGTFQIEIDITITISSNDDNNNIDPSSSSAATSIDNPSNPASVQCTRYQTDVLMSTYDSSIGKYTGTFDIPSQNSQPNILDSITVTGSSTIENPITMLLVDSQSNTLNPSYSLTSGTTLQGGPNTSISKIILQATALQDAAMDSTLGVDIVVCPVSTVVNDPSSSVVNPTSSPPQIDNQILDGAGSPDIPNIVLVAQNPPPTQPTQLLSSVSPDETVNCQEKTSSTFGTYPPDLSALTIPTKKPSKISTIQSMMGSDIYATPPTPYQSLPVQTSPDQTCFDQISFSSNPFVYDIVISTSDYTNSVDCLSPTSDCSIDFLNTKQPKITLLFNAPSCLSHLHIPSPSNVQQFSYSMYDEDGIQIQLPGAIDSQGSLLSSSGADPSVQLNQLSCGYSIILQLLTTNDNGPPMRVTIDTNGCFRNMSAITTTMPPILPPAAVPSYQSQQVPSSIPAPSNIQPVFFAPSSEFIPPPPVAPIYSFPPPPPPSSSPSPSPSSSSVVQQSPQWNQPPPPPSPSSSSIVQQSPQWNQPAPAPMITMPIQQPLSSFSTSPPMDPPVSLTCANNYQLTTLLFGSQCLSSIVTNDPSVIPDDTINPGNQGANFQENLPITITYQFNCILYLKYICMTGVTTNVNKFSYRILDINQNNISQGISTRLTSDQCIPRPLPTAELANQVIITIEETTDGQPPRNIMIDMQGCFYLSPPSAPSPPSVSDQSVSSQAEYFQPAPLPSSPPSPASILIPSAPSSSDNIRAYPILSPAPSPLPVPSSAAVQPSIPAISPLAPVSVQRILNSPILSPPPPPQVPPSLASIPSPVLQTPSPPSFYQNMLPSPILSPSPVSIPSQPVSPTSFQNIPASSVFVPPPPPPPPPSSQTILVSPVVSPPASSYPASSYSSPQIPWQPPSMPPQQYPSPIINPLPIYQAPPPSLVQSVPSPITSDSLTASISTISTQPPFIAVTPSTIPGFWPAPVVPTSSQFMAPAPQVSVTDQPITPPPASLQSSPLPIPIQAVPPSQQIPPTPLDQYAPTPGLFATSNICPQISLSSHPSVALIVFNDGTNVTSDLDPDGQGSNLVSTGTTMTVLLRNGASATFSSVGISSPNVNQIDVGLFDESSNRPLIQTPQGMIRSPLTLNPNVQNLPVNPAATLTVTFLNTIDGQPPRNVKVLVYACFPTVTDISSSPTSTIPSESQSAQYPSQTNTFNQQPSYPINPPIQTYPSTGPTSICIDPSQPAQVTSVANTPLPSEYYSSNQCVCICQTGIVIPTSSGVIQYYPPSRIINKRTIIEEYSEQHRQKH